MKMRANWFFLALLGCSACDVMLGIDGEYTTKSETGGGGQAGTGSECAYCPPQGGGGSGQASTTSSSSSSTSSGDGSSSSSSTSSSSSSSSSGQIIVQPTGQIAQVVTGGSHTCARTIAGNVKCWGNAQYGQLGLGDPGNTISIGTSPTEMGANLPYMNFWKGRTAIDIAANPWTPYVCAVLNDGSVSCWGKPVAGQSEINLLLPTSVGLPPDVSAAKVAVGRDHACALLASGGVMCWGSNRSGQFGNGEAPNSTDHIPPKYENEADLGMGRTAKAIAAGDSHTCALLDDDSVKCWGWSSWGALGLPNKSQILTPGTSAPIDFGGKKALSISTTGYHVCAVLQDKSAYCWGDNGFGQLGVGDTVFRQLPAAVLPGQPVRHISAGYRHTCAVLENGTVKCWGYNTYGELGRGDSLNTLSPTTLAHLGTGLNAAQIAAGYRHTCALLENGTIKCWGNNVYGALGIGQSALAIGDEPNEMGDNLPNVLFF